MTRLIVICIAMAITMFEIWIMSAGIMSIWGFLVVNGMFSGLHVTSMIIKNKVEDAKKIVNYNEAIKHWIASTLVMTVPAIASIFVLLIMIPNSMALMAFVLGTSVYMMVLLAIGNWANNEVD